MSAKIVKAEFFVTSPSRNFVILQLATGDGVIGVGCASRTGARANGHASDTDLESMFDSIRYEMELGYTMILVQTSVPGIEKLHGVAAQEQSSGARYDFEPANRGGWPVEEDWDTAAYMRHLPTVFEAVRNEFGPELPLLHDGHNRTTPREAAQPAKSLEPYQIKSGFHGPTDISPIGFAAELHLDINIHNYGAREYMTHTPETLEVFETTMTFENGMLHPSDTPGLGVTFHPEVAEKFPYEQAYLPYNRLADGTVHNW